MKRIKYFLINFRSFLKTKVKFSKPKNAKIMLFDYGNKDIFKKTLNDISVEVLYIRMELINFFIIQKAIKLYGIRNFSKNYIKTYIHYVKPKVIITFNELHPTFYLLKDLIKDKKITYIAIQDGFRTLPNFKNFNLKQKSQYKADMIFIFSKKYKELYSKIFNFEKKYLGSFRNNYYKKTKTKNSPIILISQYRKEYKKNEKNKYFLRERKLLFFLYKIKKKYKINFLVASKPYVTKTEYSKTFNLDQNIKIISSINFKEKYKAIDKSKLTLFMDSTLGMESLSRGNKVVSFPFKPYKNIKSFFWNCELTYQNFEKKILHLYNMSEKEWLKKIKNNEMFLNYNPGNIILKKTINRIIK